MEDINPDVAKYTFPVLTVKLHLWEITNDVNRQGYFRTQKHLLASIRFHDLEELRMEGFNHQNAILGLDITQENRPEGASPVFVVAFRPAFGIDASFKCIRVEVFDVAPCDDKGTLIG